MKHIIIASIIATGNVGACKNYNGPGVKEVLAQYDFQTLVNCAQPVLPDVTSEDAWNEVDQCLKVEAISQTGRALIWYLLELATPKLVPTGPQSMLSRMPSPDRSEIVSVVEAINRELGS